ncbi:MAG: hypothetical protein RLZZ299_2053 [Pseudomonadota bacterium]|jgi:hypothetical protein
MVWLPTLLLACGSYGLQTTIAPADGEVAVETEPLAMVTFDAVPGDGRAFARGDLAIVNIGEASVTLNAVEVSTTAPSADADVFRTEAADARDPLPLPRTMKSGERFPLKLLFRPDAVDTFQGRVLARFEGDAVIERVLVGEGCDPESDGCVAPE